MVNKSLLGLMYWPCVSAWLQEAEYIAAKSEIEKSESQLMERDNMMSTMQEELARAREEAQSNQEALLRAMEEMHVKEDKDEDDQEHGGSGITIDFCLPGYRVLFFAPFCLHLLFYMLFLLWCVHRDEIWSDISTYVWRYFRIWGKDFLLYLMEEVNLLMQTTA